MYPARHTEQSSPAQKPFTSSPKQKHSPVFRSQSPLLLQGHASVHSGPQKPVWQSSQVEPA